MSQYNTHVEMIRVVAQHLGQDLLQQTAFVGGCTTGLHLTDSVTKEDIRYTEDVDLIIHIIGYTGWHNFQTMISERGFKLATDEDIMCRFKLGNLIVDFMPDDESVLSFSNRWYKDALETAIDYPIDDSITIRLVAPCYFVATKFEAYKGRGKGDLLASRDMEDILNVVNGREELLGECQQASDDVKHYLGQAFSELLENPDIDYAVQATAHGDGGREAIIFERLEQLAEI